jgi:hypothetical protein
MVVAPSAWQESLIVHVPANCENLSEPNDSLRILFLAIAGKSRRESVVPAKIVKG